MPTAHLIYGFNVRNSGATTTDKLRPSFEARGWNVVEHDYGWRGLLGVRFGNRKRAQMLADKIKCGDILIGHSDGCNIITEACWILASVPTSPQVNAAFFNPALDRDTPQSPIVGHVLAFHTETDLPVRLARWLPFHPWGQAGRKGFINKGRKVYTNVPYERLGITKAGHSGIFLTPTRIKRAMGVFDDWMQEIVG